MKEYKVDKSEEIVNWKFVKFYFYSFLGFIMLDKSDKMVLVVSFVFIVYEIVLFWKCFNFDSIFKKFVVYYLFYCCYVNGRCNCFRCSYKWNCVCVNGKEK